MPCQFAVLQYCSCLHQKFIPIKCDRPGCRGVCKDEPSRCEAVCLVRYIWSYEVCAEKSFSVLNHRIFQENYDAEAKTLENAEHLTRELGKRFLDASTKKFGVWREKRQEKQNKMKEEIRTRIEWVKFFGQLLANVQKPISDAGKLVIARILSYKPTRELLVIRTHFHSYVELMLMQNPPKLYMQAFLKRDRQQFRRARLPPVPLFDERLQDFDAAIKPASDRDVPMKSIEQASPQKLLSGNSPGSMSDLAGAPSASTSPSLTSPGKDAGGGDSSVLSSVSPGDTFRYTPTDDTGDEVVSPRPSSPRPSVSQPVSNLGGFFGQPRPPIDLLSRPQCRPSPPLPSIKQPVSNSGGFFGQPSPPMAPPDQSAPRIGALPDLTPRPASTELEEHPSAQAYPARKRESNSKDDSQNG